MALAEPASEYKFEFKCRLSTTLNDAIYVDGYIDIEDQIRFRINEQAIDAKFVPNAANHSPTIAFAASFLSNVFTLVIHRDFFLPHPEGYDPSAPPATLTVQHADARIVPTVDVYLGHCSIE